MSSHLAVYPSMIVSSRTPLNFTPARIALSQNQDVRTSERLTGAKKKGVFGACKKGSGEALVVSRIQEDFIRSQN